MSATIKNAFLPEAAMVVLEKILPSKRLKPGSKKTARYKMIEASVREVGIIEPLIVYRDGKAGTYLLLDGHVRLEILRDLGRVDALCLVSLDDENCTYNIEVSRLAPIQECRMILNAIAQGVPEDRIARSLNVTPKTIKDSRSKLTDISSDAIEILKDKPVADMALRLLKKVKPYRQVEMAELMVLSSMYTVSYAKALFAATSSDQLAAPPKVDTRPEQLAKLETEMRAIEREFVVQEDSFSRDTLNLQLARGYLKTLLGNTKVGRYLSQKHGELLGQLKKVVEVTSLDAD
jgi:ParB-like chromosome segregation protein Spo0J